MAQLIAAERAALADANRKLDERVRVRTRKLEQADYEHKAFAYGISHDLRVPLRTLSGFSEALYEDCGTQLDDTARDYLARIRNGAQTMSDLIEGLLKLSRISQVATNNEQLNLSALCEELIDELRKHEPRRDVAVEIQADIHVRGDRHLLRDALANLLANARKFTARMPRAQIRFGAEYRHGSTVYYLRDNGAGFDQAYADKLFVPFQRLHHARDFPGAGIGVSTVRRIIQRHGGTVWVSSQEGCGVTAYFTLHPPPRRINGRTRSGPCQGQPPASRDGPILSRPTRRQALEFRPFRAYLGNRSAR